MFERDAKGNDFLNRLRERDGWMEILSKVRGHAKHSRKRNIYYFEIARFSAEILFEAVTSLRCVYLNWSVIRCSRVAFLIPLFKKAKRCRARESAWLYACFHPRVYNYFSQRQMKIRDGRSLDTTGRRNKNRGASTKFLTDMTERIMTNDRI